MDFGDIFAGIDSATAVTAIIAVGAIMALPRFARWAVKTVANFF